MWKTVENPQIFSRIHLTFNANNRAVEKSENSSKSFLKCSWIKIEWGLRQRRRKKSKISVKQNSFKNVKIIKLTYQQQRAKSRRKKNFNGRKTLFFRFFFENCNHRPIALQRDEKREAKRPQLSTISEFSLFLLNVFCYNFCQCVSECHIIIIEIVKASERQRKLCKTYKDTYKESKPHNRWKFKEKCIYRKQKIALAFTHAHSTLKWCNHISTTTFKQWATRKLEMRIKRRKKSKAKCILFAHATPTSISATQHIYTNIFIQN